MRDREQAGVHKFGYACAVEKSEIASALRADGWTGIALHFEIDRVYLERHKNRPSLRQRQDFWRAFADPPKPVLPVFTPEELARIAEHFAGANDALAQTIHAKAARL